MNVFSLCLKRCVLLLLPALFLLSALGVSPVPGAAAIAEAVEAETELIVYNGPTTMKSSENAIISANGTELFVYDVMVNHQRIWSADSMPTDTPMTYFDFSGCVTIDIRMPGLPKGVESAAVLPSSMGISPTVKDGVVSFTVTEAGQYTVIFNDDVNKAVHIFANPLQTDIPDPAAPDVYYIPAGEWTIDAISLKDGQTLYLEGGAVLHSVVSVSSVSDVKICGRGMIDGSDYPAWNQTGSYARVPIDLNHAKNITVEGIILANGNCWNFNSYACTNVRVDNVKIISGRQNGDGFTFQSCRDHVVTNSFARTWDDSLVIKNYSASTDGITFRNMQVWTDLAQSMEIGYETDKGYTLDPEISNVLFEDITVLYNFHKPVISIHNSDDAYVHDITYHNIMVENAYMQGDNGNNKELIEMTLQNSGWSTVTDEFGSIDNVLIDGLTVVRTPEDKVPRSRMSGVGEDNMITNVTLRNVNILGSPIEDLKALKLSTDDYCDMISVEYAPEYTVPGPNSGYSYIPADEISTALTIIKPAVQESSERPACFENPEDNYIPMPDGENLAVGKPVTAGAHTDVYVKTNVNDGKTDTYWESKGFPAEMTIELGKEYDVSTVAVRLNPSSIWETRIQEIAVLVSSDGDSYTEIAAAEKYSFDPETGNRIRIDFDTVSAAYVRVVFTMNSSSRTGGAQAAEIEIYS